VQLTDMSGYCPISQFQELDYISLLTCISAVGGHIDQICIEERVPQEHWHLVSSLRW
jgi:hypothetical protein